MSRAIFISAVLGVVGLQAAETFTYSYDAAGRLKQAGSSQGTRLGYVYDAAGNLLSRTVETFVDSDGDQMDDTWESIWFGTLSRNGAGDSDGDGQSDRHEFVSGTNPTSAQSVLKIGAVDVSSGSITVSWQSVAGKSYQLQYKNSLGDASWIELSGQVTATGATASKMDNTAAGVPKRSYRVVVGQ